MNNEMSKPEAEIYLTHAREEWEKKFCPILKGKCNLNCVSYSPGFIYKHSAGGFDFHVPKCSCALIVGKKLEGK